MKMMNKFFKYQIDKIFVIAFLLFISLFTYTPDYSKTVVLSKGDIIALDSGTTFTGLDTIWKIDKTPQARQIPFGDMVLNLNYQVSTSNIQLLYNKYGIQDDFGKLIRNELLILQQEGYAFNELRLEFNRRYKEMGLEINLLAKIENQEDVIYPSYKTNKDKIFFWCGLFLLFCLIGEFISLGNKNEENQTRINH